MENVPYPNTQRQKSLQKLTADTLDLLVVGGGIVGAGVARDAAMRGLKVGLIEQSDFASGTSSRSSRLLHGGLRYLSQGYLRLVHEASQEKRILHQIAPHLAEPLPFLFPTRSGLQWAKWKLSIGVKLYDLLCGRRNLGKSTTLSRNEILGLLKGLKHDDITGAVRYYDGLTNDSRLVLDTLRSAAKHDALVLNYVQFEDSQREGDHWQCKALNTITSRQLDIKAKCIINATGPWSDKLPHSHTKLRLTKGVHLIIDRERLPVPDAVVLTEGDRILFAIPWGNRVILGTTDTDYDGPPELATCDPEDIRYILDVIATLFPDANLTESDILHTWTGLRPLVADRHGNPSDISRRHEIKMGEPGWWDITGGKLTTYRLMAEQATNQVIRYLGCNAEPCRTATTKLLDSPEIEGVSGILPPAITPSTVQHYCHNEWAIHLDDVMVRRTSWHYYHRDNLDVAEQVVDWMSETLCWDNVTRAREFERYASL